MSRFIPVETEKWMEMVKAQAENARLKAEVERLTAFTTRTIIPNEELQAQVERLTKAGDAMAKTIDDNGCHDNGDWDECLEVMKRWEAAKEGKQLS